MSISDGNSDVLVKMLDLCVLKLVERKNEENWVKYVPKKHTSKELNYFYDILRPEILAIFSKYYSFHLENAHTFLYFRIFL